MFIFLLGLKSYHNPGYIILSPNKGHVAAINLETKSFTEQNSSTLIPHDFPYNYKNIAKKERFQNSQKRLNTIIFLKAKLIIKTEYSEEDAENQIWILSHIEDTDLPKSKPQCYMYNAYSACSLFHLIEAIQKTSENITLHYCEYQQMFLDLEKQKEIIKSFFNPKQYTTMISEQEYQLRLKENRKRSAPLNPKNEEKCYPHEKKIKSI